MKFFLVLTFLGSTVVFSADTVKQIYEALEATWGKGIEAKRFFRCVDPDGRPVPGAYVDSGLYPDGSFENAIIHKRFTDTNGMFVVEGRTDGEISFTVNKEGYYETHQQIRLSRDPNVTLRNGRWEPYGITNTVIVKDIRNPIPMYVSRAWNEQTVPQLNTPIGFDLEKNDWVAPYGRGEIADRTAGYRYGWRSEYVIWACNRFEIVSAVAGINPDGRPRTRVRRKASK